jgi:hypothetical protein
LWVDRLDVFDRLADIATWVGAFDAKFCADMPKSTSSQSAIRNLKSEI